MADEAGSSSKEIKNALKLAKEAIVAKEYKTALKYCKNVLKLDKNNYNALVFTGLCAAEMEHYDQARAAYLRAADVAPEKILAWQGLSNLFDKITKPEWIHDMEKTYAILLRESTSDITKQAELCEKITAIKKTKEEFLEAFQLLYSLADKQTSYPEKLKILSKALDMLDKSILKSGLTRELLNQLKETVEKVILFNGAGSDFQAVIKTQVHFLLDIAKTANKNDLENEIKQQCMIWLGKLTEDTKFKSWAISCICRVYLNADTLICPKEGVEFFKQLLEEDKDSAIAHTGLAWNEYNNSALGIGHLPLLKKGLNDHPLSLLLQSLLTLKMHDTSRALHLAMKGMEMADSLFFNSSRDFLVTQLRLTCIKALLSRGNATDVEEAKALLDQEYVHAGQSEELLYLFGKYKLSRHDFDGLQMTVADIAQLNPQSAKIDLLMGEFNLVTDKLDDAKERLTKAVERLSDDPEAKELLGDVYRQLASDAKKEFYQQSYQLYLQAARLDPYNSRLFRNLGDYYANIATDLIKAQKCYKKALSLQPRDETLCLALAKTCAALKDKDGEYAAYKSLTSIVGPEKSKVAWVRLGLCQLKRQEINAAIASFQSVLRLDPSDSFVWECVADAYMSRGSFNAANKAFARALELKPGSVYPTLRIANIQQTLHLYPEAIQEYRSVLQLCPDYIPALAGLSESLLSLARTSFKDCFVGRSCDFSSQALDALARGVALRPSLVYWWKMIADATSFFHAVAKEYVNVHVPDDLLKLMKLDRANFANGKILVLAVCNRALEIHVQLSKDSALAWHDLGLASFNLGKVIGSDEGKKILLEGLRYTRKAVELDPSMHQFWNTLGVMYGCAEINMPSHSQHAFIRSLRLNPNSSLAWSNLGALYLKFGKAEVAHEAFKRGQATDPTNPEPWVGQASIAESIGNEDAMDLFRHSTELGYSPQGSIGYGHWVCTSIKTLPAEQRYSKRPRPDISHLPKDYHRIVLNASVAVEKCLNFRSEDACLWNIHGMLLEHQALPKQALKAYLRAREVLQATGDHSKHLHDTLINICRAQTKAGDKSVAIEKVEYESCEQALAYGLMYYYQEQYEEALKAYSAVASFTQDPRTISCVYVAVAMILYAAGNTDEMKSYLLQSSQTGNACFQGLVCLAALGLSHEDAALITAALQEIQRHPEIENEKGQFILQHLLSIVFRLQGRQMESLSTIKKGLVRHPASGPLWSLLSEQLLHCTSKSEKSLRNVAAVAHENTRSVTTQLMLVTSSLIGCRLEGGSRRTPTSCREFLRQAQQLVHCHPNNPKAWVLLSSALSASQLGSRPDKSSSIFGSVCLSTLRKVFGLYMESKQKIEDFSAEAVARDHVTHDVTFSKWSFEFVFILLASIDNLSLEILQEANEMVGALCDDECLGKELMQLMSFLLAAQNMRALNDVEKLLALMKVSVTHASLWEWQMLANICQKCGRPLAAEFCYRQIIRLASQADSERLKVVALFRLTGISLQCAALDNNERWTALAKEAVNQLMQLQITSPELVFFNAVTCHLQGDDAACAKLLLQVNAVPCSGLADLVSAWEKKITDA